MNPNYVIYTSNRVEAPTLSSNFQLLLTSNNNISGGMYCTEYFYTLHYNKWQLGL